MRKYILSATVLAFFIIAGCGGGGGSDESSQSSSSQQEGLMFTADMNATITGSVKFTGTPPTRRPIKQDNECSAMHTEPVLMENVVVNENGTLKWAFVYVKEGLGDRKFGVPAEPVLFDQKGCMYDPHVFGVQTGQNIKILNSDPLLHNIHALPNDNRPFNFGMPKQGDVRERDFKKTEVMVRIKCDVHPWMGAYCGVVDHPYFSTSGDDGTFTIKNLPPGKYVLEVWHETYGTMTQTVTVGDGETKMANFTYTGKESAS